MKKTIIAVANQKGGVGKTTTTINLAACLAEKRKKVLLIDLDPQGNATSGFGLDKNSLDKTIYEVILGESDINETILNNVIPFLDLLPSNTNLAGGELDLIDLENRENILKSKIEEANKKYDFVLIDCPPSLSLLTINAMTAADAIMVPVQCEYYALEGLMQLTSTIDLIKKKLNKDLIIDGIVFTMADMRTNLSQEVIQNVRENLKEYIYEAVIPRNIRLAEAPSFGMPINLYDDKSTGAQSYRELAKEFIKKHK